MTLQADTWAVTSGTYVYVCGGTGTSTLLSVRDATSGRSLRTFDPVSRHACPTLLREAGSSW